jgi:DNA-binding NtrC family response regulator
MAQDDGTELFIKRVIGEGPALNVADQRTVTIRAFSTTHPWDRPALEEGLRAAYLPRDRDVGVLSFLSGETSPDVRVVIGKQGDRRFRRYDYETHNVDVYEIANVITDHAAVRYQPDEDDMLRFMTIGGGNQLTQTALNGFHALWLRMDEGGVEALAIQPERMCERALSSDFLDRLNLIKFQSKKESYRSIEHTEFKSRDAFDAECERFRELRDDPELLVQAFGADVDVLTANLEKPVTIRFEVRAASGSIKLVIPRIPWRRQLQGTTDQSYAFYDLVEATLEKILGRDFFVRADNAEGLTRVDGVFPQWAPTAPFKDRLRSAKLRRTALLETLDANGLDADWIPVAHAFDELVVKPEIAADVGESLGMLAFQDPQRLLALLRGCMKESYRALAGLCFEALLGARADLPGPLVFDADRLIAAWLLKKPDTRWALDRDAEGVVGDDVRLDLDDLPGDGRAAVLRAGLAALVRDGGLDDHEAIEWGLTQLRLAGLTTAESELLDGALLLNPKGLAGLLPTGSAPVSPEDLEQAACERAGLPLLPRLEIVQSGSERALRNSGRGTAWRIEARPGSDKGALTCEALRPGEEWPLLLTLLTAPQVHVGFHALGRAHQVVLGAEEAAPVPLRRRRNQIAPRQLWKIRRRLDPELQFAAAGNAMLPVFRELHAAELVDGPVLLLGETGVGKSTVAEILHRRWANGGKLERAPGAASGGDATIQRGEWFGYGKKHGIKDVPPNKPGYLLRARGGTLFVDDADALSPELQALLLDPVEGRPVALVGGDKAAVDCRFIFATNRPIEELRGDLVGRLTSVVRVPPLRERPFDVLLLARLVADAAEVRLSAQAWLAIARHRDWPGNIRDVQSVVQTAAALAKTAERKTIELDDLPEQIPDDALAAAEGLGEDEARAELWRLADAAASEEGFSKGGGRQDRAAHIMGVGKTTASHFYKRFGLAESA